MLNFDTTFFYLLLFVFRYFSQKYTKQKTSGGRQPCGCYGRAAVLSARSRVREGPDSTAYGTNEEGQYGVRYGFSFLDI